MWGQACSLNSALLSKYLIKQWHVASWLLPHWHQAALCPCCLLSYTYLLYKDKSSPTAVQTFLDFSQCTNCAYHAAHCCVQTYRSADICIYSPLPCQKSWKVFQIMDPRCLWPSDLHVTCIGRNMCLLKASQSLNQSYSVLSILRARKDRTRNRTFCLIC